MKPERKTNIFGNGLPDEYRLPFPGVVKENKTKDEHPQGRTFTERPESGYKPMKRSGSIHFRRH